MKKSTKILLGIATIWPVVYMLLFFLTIFSFMISIPFAQSDANKNAQSIDLIQLEQKIKNGEVKLLTIRGDKLTATDRVGDQEFYVYVTNEQSRDEILKQAREMDGSGRPRVEKVEVEPDSFAPAIFPIGFAALFAVHLFTMLLIMGLMAFYIVQVVRTDRLDQNMRILWTILICMVAMGAMPVYWYLYIWREPLAVTPPLPSP